MNMPVIQSAFIGWMKSITLLKITQSNDDNGITVDTQIPIVFMGTIQPYKPAALEVKASGERSWNWLQIHTPYKLSTQLNNNDLIKYSGVNYKIMMNNDYQINGYYEYHLVEDYNG